MTRPVQADKRAIARQVIIRRLDRRIRRCCLTKAVKK
jgi:hypothetical protein